MPDQKSVSRRNFLRQSSLGVTAGLASVSMPASVVGNSIVKKKLPSEVCVVGIDMKGLWPDTTAESRLKRMLERMDRVSGLEPDIICLPELFDTMWLQEKKHIREIAEDEKVAGPVTGRVVEFAKKNNTYVVCPVITLKDGKYFNSSLLIDRQGNIAGAYHKIHPLQSEILPDQDLKGGGVVPGAVDQPLVETDFGKVGMKICFDANWEEGWEDLKKKGADIVLFSSAFPRGRMLNYYALHHGYYIVSATGGDARVIDISGNNLDASSEFVRYAWSTVNLDKVNVTTWPTCDRLPDLFRKYQERIRVKVWGTTGVITIESRDPELRVMTALKEFNIPTYAQLTEKETAVQIQYRPK